MSLSRVRWSTVAIGIIALFATVYFNITFTENSKAYLSHHTQMLLLVVGWALCIWGFSGIKTLHIPRFGALARTPSHLFALTLIVWVAFFVRMVNLETGIHRTIDEIHSMEAVGDMRYGGNQRVLTPINAVTSFTWVYNYTQLFTTQLWGASLTAIRLPSVIFGVLQVIAVFGLARAFWGVRVGLMSALILATFPPHVHFSRIGLNNIVEPTFVLFAMLFLVRALRRPSLAHYALFGGFLGLTHYFYEGGRLFYTPFIVAWVGWMFLTHRPSVRPSARGLAVALMTFVLVAFPVYYVWLTNETPLFPRFGVVGRDIASFTEGGLPSVWRRFIDTFGIYTVNPEQGSFYKNDTGFILPALVPFFALGFGVALLRIRRMGEGLLVWWVVGVAVANMLVGDSLSSPRYCIVFPALAMLMSLGLNTLLGGVARVNKRSVRPLFALFAVAITLGQTYHYHGYHLGVAYSRQFFFEYDIVTKVWTRDIEDMMFRALELPPKSVVIVIAEGFPAVSNMGSLLWYYGRGENRDLSITRYYTRNVSRDWLKNIVPNPNFYFFIEPNDEATLALLSEFFTLSAPHYSPYNIPPERQFVMYGVQ